MKTEREIRAKIEELIDRADRKPYGADSEELLCNIDALLWVIEDESGKAI